MGVKHYNHDTDTRCQEETKSKTPPSGPKSSSIENDLVGGGLNEQPNSQGVKPNWDSHKGQRQY
jgi:hypothetical protein